MHPRRAVEKREELQTPQKSESKVFGVFFDAKDITKTANRLIKNHKERGIGDFADVLDMLLPPAAGIAVKHRGNIVAVEGDSLLITFETLEDVLRFCQEVQPHRRTTIPTQDGGYTLLLDIGIARGNLYEFVAGDDSGRAYLAVGSALREAYRMEKYSENGDIALNFPIRGLTHRRRGHHVIHGSEISGIEIPEPKKEGTIKKLKKMIGIARPEEDGQSFWDDEKYLDSFISRNIPKDSTCRVYSPVIIFSSFPLIRLAFSKLNGRNPDPVLAGEVLNQFYLGVRDIVERKASGYIDKFKDEGSLFLIGAPLTPRDPKKLAFQALEEIHDLHLGLSRQFGFPILPSVSGMNTGDALCGPIVERWTTIGASVNKAAKLMAEALPGEKEQLEGENRRIWFTSSMYDESTARLVKGHEVDKMRLQGFQEMEIIYGLGEDPQAVFAVSTVVDFVEKAEKKKQDRLRQKEHDELVDKAGVCMRWAGYGASINVIGETGSGKDRLLSQVADTLRDSGCRTFEVQCKALYRKEPYRALFELMKNVCGVYSDEQLFREFIGKKPESGKERKELLDKFSERLLEEPTAFIINNGDNIDLESRNFFDELGPALVAKGCFAVFSGSSETEDPNRSRLFSSGEDMVLENLSVEQAKEFAKKVAHKHHPGADLHERELNKIVETSRGNPLFISELVNAMEPEYRRLRFRGKIPKYLRDAVIRTVQDTLTHELQAVLAKYALMHSVPHMAPLMDPEARKHMHALAEHGFLTPEFEFSSSMLKKELLKKVLKKWMDSRERQDLCTAMAKAAEAAGMDDHFVIFEYYKDGRLTPENRMKALEHAYNYVLKKGFLYLVLEESEELFEDAIAVADRRYKAQKRILGLMHNWKAIVLMADYSDDEHSEKIGRMNELLELARKSYDYLEGHKEEYKPLVQVARALSYIAYFETLELGDEKAAREKLNESRELFEHARRMSLQAGDIANYIGIASNYSHSLIHHHKAPVESFQMLHSTGQEIPQLLSGIEIDRPTKSRIANLYLAIAEAALECKDHKLARENIEIAIERSKEIDYEEGLAYSLGVKAKILYADNDPWHARDFAAETLELAGDSRIISADFKRKMNSIIEAVGRRIGGVSGEIGS